MIRGAHFLLYSADPEADRVFFRDVLGFPYVDDRDGWLIFKLPAAEMASLRRQLFSSNMVMPRWLEASST